MHRNIQSSCWNCFPTSAKEINDRICLGFYKSPYIFHPFHHSVSRQLLDIVHNHSNTLVILKKPHLCWSIRFHTICILHHLKCFYYSAANWAPSRCALRQISVRHDWERAFLSFPRFRNLSSFFPPKDSTTTKNNDSLNVPIVHAWTETGDVEILS